MAKRYAHSVVDLPTDVPPITTATAFHTIADKLEAIRREWIDGDTRMGALLARGFTTGSSGFAEIVRFEIRQLVAGELHTIRGSLDALPLVLRHCDPSLRDSLQAMLKALDLDSIHTDRYGDEAERWRQTWPAMNLDADMDELIPKLRAKGDELRLPKPSARSTPAVKLPKTRRGMQRLAATSVKDQRIIAEIHAGQTYREVAKICKVSKSTVGRVAKAYGLNSDTPETVPLAGTLSDSLGIRETPRNHRKH